MSQNLVQLHFGLNKHSLYPHIYRFQMSIALGTWDVSKVKFKGFAFMLLSRRLLMLDQKFNSTHSPHSDWRWRAGSACSDTQASPRCSCSTQQCAKIPSFCRFESYAWASPGRERRKIEDYRKIALESKPKLSNVMRLSSLTNGHRSVKSLRPYENAALCCVSKKIAITKIVNLIFRNVDILQWRGTIVN